MREIKFRAWDREVKEMLLPKKIWHLFAWDEDGNQPINIMQYTGLKDKNGIEIYEGDLIYISGYGIYEVEFPFIELYDRDDINDIGKILGNIYENPELLMETKWK